MKLLKIMYKLIQFMKPSIMNKNVNKNKNNTYKLKVLIISSIYIHLTIIKQFKIYSNLIKYILNLSNYYNLYK
jgi:hypothetical protein